MVVLDLTSIFSDIVDGMPGLEEYEEYGFIHGNKGLQNLKADSEVKYPCTFLDSPRVGRLKLLKSGAMEIEYRFVYAVLNKVELDDEEDARRSVIDAMGDLALYIFGKLSPSLKEVYSGEWVEVESMFDAGLAGWMVEVTYTTTINSISIC